MLVFSFFFSFHVIVRCQTVEAECCQTEPIMQSYSDILRISRVEYWAIYTNCFAFLHRLHRLFGAAEKNRQEAGRLSEAVFIVFHFLSCFTVAEFLTTVSDCGLLRTTNVEIQQLKVSNFLKCTVIPVSRWPDPKSWLASHSLKIAAELVECC